MTTAILITYQGRYNSQKRRKLVFGIKTLKIELSKNPLRKMMFLINKNSLKVPLTLWAYILIDDSIFCESNM